MKNSFIITIPLILGQSRSYLACLVLITSLTGAFSSFGQYHFSTGANYIYAFGDRTVELQSNQYDLQPTHGYEITANNGYRFSESNLDVLLKVGFRQLYFSGSSENLTYSGQLNKFVSSLGIRYRFTDKIGFAGYIEAENNLPLDDFYAGAGDLFRVCLSAEGSYALSKKLAFTALVSRAMTPITEAYILTNPQYQVRIGLTYTLKP